jgi:(1->4)-alpha-D-glucan 1-alpha-D-glucosylmutase
MLVVETLVHIVTPYPKPVFSNQSDAFIKRSETDSVAKSCNEIRRTRLVRREHPPDFSPMPQLRATYRLQLNRDFTFSRAKALVPYLAGLGISHLYLSPILMARPGSTHGYDTVDHEKLNPDLGLRADFEALAHEAHRHGMGLIADFVPNHMGIGTAENRAWQDVLTHGRNSAFAHWFDIDFDAGPIRVPVLDRPLPQAIAAKIVRHEGDVVMAGDTPLPLRPEDRGGGDLEAMLERQHWRLIHYARAADELNYRRFFAISDLAGIRIEDEHVFAATHKLLIELAESGLIDGVRIDHIDGLRDPTGYLERLRQALPARVFVHVEKILGEDETLPDDWPVSGTTGYEFASQLTNLFIEPESERILNGISARMGGDARGFQVLAREAKNEVMDRLLAVELNGLARLAERQAGTVADYADLTAAQLSRAIRAFVAELDIYRSYLPATEDRRRLERALAAARERGHQLDPRLFDFFAGRDDRRAHRG